jgi:hypothetical protein
MVIGVCYNMANMLLFPTHFRPIAPVLKALHRWLQYVAISIAAIVDQVVG